MLSNSINILYWLILASLFRKKNNTQTKKILNVVQTWSGHLKVVLHLSAIMFNLQSVHPHQ